MSLARPCGRANGARRPDELRRLGSAGRRGRAGAGPLRRPVGRVPVERLARENRSVIRALLGSLLHAGDGVARPLGRRLTALALTRSQTVGPALGLGAQMADRAARDLGERQQPEKSPGRERREHHKDEPDQEPGGAASRAERRASEREDCHHRELRDDQRDEHLCRPRRPHAPRRPDHRREGEREHQHDDVDSGVAHQELDPQQHGAPRR